MNIGKTLHFFARKIWKFNRSLTGNGNRKTLKELQKISSLLKIKEIKSGTKVFDWTVPKEWQVNSA
jgi:aminopeptidase-like protein